jgi:hypothetical protein
MDFLYALADWIYRFMESGPPFPAALVWILVASAPATLIHELGHAVAARQLLGEEVEVSVGSAGKIAQVRLAGVDATIKALPHPGRAAGFASFGDASARAIDVVWIAVAGPLASLCGLLLAGGLLSAAPDTGLTHDFLWATVFLCFGGILSLIPFSYQDRRDGPQNRTDGRLALDAMKVVWALR